MGGGRTVEDDWSDVGWLGGVVSSPQKKGELWQKLALIYKQTRLAGDLSLSKFDLGAATLLLASQIPSE